MKIKKYILSILVCSLGVFQSCDKFLEIEPLDRVPASQLLNDVNGVKVLLATLYNYMPIEDFTYNPTRSFSYYGAIDYPDTRGWSLSFLTDESINTMGSGVGPIDDGYWQSTAYQAIRQLNMFMDNLATIEMKENDRSRLISEAHFIRAYYYFGLAKRYGGVPLIDKVLEYMPGTANEALFIPRSTEKETWDFILKECDLAIANLPATITSQDGVYRATKWAAYALKSRAALHAASVAKYWDRAPMAGDAVTLKLVGGMTIVDADNYYQQCIDASNALIVNSGKQLYKPNPANPAEAAKNYQDIFQNPNTGEVKNEVIFAKAYLPGSATQNKNGHSYDTFFNPAQTNNGFRYFGRFSPALNLVDLYEDYSNDGTGNSIPLVTRTDGNENYSVADPTKLDVKIPFKKYDNPMDIFKNKDARLFGSIIVPGATWKGVSIVIQGGFIKTDGKTNVYAQASATGKDGKTYYALGAATQTEYSGFSGLGTIETANYTCTGFSLKKFLQEGKNIEGVPFSSTTDYIDFRLPEIYLNYAEAVVESGKGDAALAKNYLNLIRKRAGHTDQIPATLDNILKERRIELAFEGHRYWDLVRRREAHKLFSSTRRKALVPMLDLREDTPKYIFVRANIFYDEKSNGVTFQPKSYYRSIPGVATSNLVQNPEY